MKIEDVIIMPAGVVVGREIVNASFEQWMAHVFDRTYAETHWCWGNDFIRWNVPHTETVGYIIRTFENSVELLRPLSDGQIAGGLEYIWTPALSDVYFAFRDKSVPWMTRKRAINSLRTLYSDCFRTRCRPLLSHLDQLGEYPLNTVCYMLWDVFPLDGQPEKLDCAEEDNECLKIMEFALGLESLACQESALHGLGHWALNYPERVCSIVDHFIKTSPTATSELIAYAEKAREGNVL